MTLKVVAGRDIEEREALKAARKRARPILARWFKEGEAHARGERPVKLRQVHVAFMRALANCGPSANHGFSYQSQARAGAKIGAAKRTARQYCADLTAAGLLTVQRRGFGRTSLWTFCIDGAPLFAASDRHAHDASDRHAHDASDRHAHDASDRHAHDANPFDSEPFDFEPLEEQPASPPTPPPRSKTPRTRTGEIANAIMAAVPVELRRLPVWQALPTWIEATCAADDVLPVDVVLGVTGALPSLQGATLSTLRYFDRAVVRASEARRRDLPSGGYVLLAPYSDEWKAERARKIAAGESVRFMDHEAAKGSSWAVRDGDGAA